LSYEPTAPIIFSRAILLFNLFKYFSLLTASLIVLYSSK